MHLRILLLILLLGLVPQHATLASDPDTLTITWSADRGSVTVRWTTDPTGPVPCVGRWTGTAWQILEGTCQHQGEGLLINTGNLIGMRFALLDSAGTVRIEGVIPAPYTFYLPIGVTP